MEDLSLKELKFAPRLRLHLNVHEPVELVEMTLALQGLGLEYQGFLKPELLKRDSKANASEVKLFVTHIESNCILAELAPALPLFGVMTPVLADVNTVQDFVKNISEMIDWFKSVFKQKAIAAEDVPYSKRRINNVSNVLKLVARSKDSNLGLSAIKYEEEIGVDRVVLEVLFTDKECRQAELGASRAVAALDVREKADCEKVLMYFYQTNIEDPKAGGRTGDKAIISSISSEALRVYVIPETDQQKVRYVLDDKTSNPLYTGFVVDVNIEKDRNGNPKIYRVVRVHDIIYDEPNS